MMIFSILFYSYIICILAFVFGFNKVKEFKNKTAEERTAFSVIISFRNEEKNLPNLLESISQLAYSNELVEFIFVDDTSTDNSIEIIKNFIDYQVERSRNLQPHDSARGDNFIIIKNERTSNSPKKDAITIALNQAKNNWIITTDADCVVPKNWLRTIDTFIQQNNCNMVVAPVSYKSSATFLHQFQRLEFMSLQATTIGSFGLKIPFLSNGANFIYKKNIFKKVNGFENNNSIASGDDVFLLEKFLNFDKRKVKYLKSKDAIVETFPVDSVSELVHQRVRWASKTANYNLIFGKIIGVLVLAGNTVLAILPLLLFFNLLSFQTFISSFLLKLFSDYILLERMSIFENKKIDFITYFKSSILYPYFTLFIFIKSFSSNYKWKKRTFKK